MKRLLVFLLCASAVFLSCKDNQVESALNSAEISMNDNPESSLEVLESIDKDLLSTRKQNAKYALLYSMALDKNYIDIKIDSIIAPAVKYYECHGSKEERFLCNYYHARIYENAGDNENALLYAVKAESINTAKISSDNLCLLYAMKGRIYYDVWRINDAIEAYLSASQHALNSCKYCHYSYYCLKLADLYMYNHDQTNFNINLRNAELYLEHFTLREAHEYHRLRLLQMMDNNVPSYECIQYAETYISKYPQYELINWHIISKVYLYADDATKAYEMLKLYEDNHELDTVTNYWGVLAKVYEALGQYKEALLAYVTFATSVKDKDVERHLSDIKLVEERYENKIIQNHQQHVTIYMLILVSLLIIFISYIYMKFKIEHKKNLQDIADLKQEYTALSLLNERIDNTYKYLSCQLTIQNFTDQELKRVLGQRIRSLSVFLQKPVPDSLSRVTAQIEDLKKNKNYIVDSIGLLYAVSYPDFVGELMTYNLTSAEIGYCCLYLLGLNIPEAGEVIGKVSSIYNVNSAIRKKIGVSGANLDKWLIKRFTELYPVVVNEKDVSQN